MKKHLLRAGAGILLLCLALNVFIPFGRGMALAEVMPDIGSVGCALLADASTGKTVFEKDADRDAEFAGLVRLPALLYICRSFDSGAILDNTVVTVSREAAAIKGATAFLAPDERISAAPLLKAAVMLNAGDAVCALMQALCPAEAAAAGAVTALLNDLGIEKQAESCLCTGMSFSAREIAVIAMELAKSPSFLKYSSVYTDTLPHETAADTELVNPNRLVRHYSGCYGLATGSVGGSQYCGAFIARRGSTVLLAVVAGAESSDARFAAARNMLDSGFSAYRTVDLNTEGDAVAVLPVTGGILRSVSVVTGGRVSALMPINDTKVTTMAELPEICAAPISEGDVLGRLVIRDSTGNELGEVPLVAAHSVDAAGYWDYVILMLNGFLRRRDSA